MLRIVAILVACIAAPASAIVFEDGGVHVIDANNSYPLESVIVADGPGGKSTTVALVDGGFIGGNFEPSDTSKIVMDGGTVGGDLNTFGSSIVEIGGGSIDWFLQVDYSSLVTMTGGSVGNKISAFREGTLTIVGNNFAVDGLPVAFGNLAAIAGTLTGTLASGEPMNNPFARS